MTVAFPVDAEAADNRQNAEVNSSASKGSHGSNALPVFLPN